MIIVLARVDLLSLGPQASLTLSTFPSSIHVSFFSQFLLPPFIACIELVSLGPEARFTCVQTSSLLSVCLSY